MHQPITDSHPLVTFLKAKSLKTKYDSMNSFKDTRLKSNKGNNGTLKLTIFWCFKA